MNRLELREWRQVRYLSLTRLGELLGVDRQTVFRWEAGTTTVPPYLHLALAHLDTQHTWSRKGMDLLPSIGRRAS